MAWQDDLEPGQDDLVREDKASAKFRRAMRRQPSGIDESLYTDHNAGDPSQFTSDAERVRQPRGKKRQSPVKSGGLLDRIRNARANLSEMWQEALREAEQRQASKNKKKGG